MLISGLLVSGLLYSATEAEAAPAPQAVLSLQEAVQTALAQQPQLRQAYAGTEAAFARADEARAPLLPQLNLSAIYSRSSANCTARPGSVGCPPTAPPPSWRSFNYFQLGATASQLIWDFNFTLDRWRSAKANAQSQQFLERATQQQTILGVQVAYFNASARKELVRVARETLDNQVRHLRQIEGFVRVGTRPEIDLAQARTDEANARVQLITSQNNYEIGKAQLNQAIGVERSTDYEVGNDTLNPLPQEDESTDPLLDEALRTRPEFASLEQQVHAQQFIVRSVRGAYFPSLGLAASFTDNGPALDNLTWNWNAQLQLQWNIFQGLLTTSQGREARANLRAIEAQRDVVRQQVRFEVEQARLALRGAKAALVAAVEALANARIRLTLAERRYQTGVGGIIELGDAQLAFTNAAAQEVSARFNVATTRAQLLKAIGGTTLPSPSGRGSG